LKEPIMLSLLLLAASAPATDLALLDRAAEIFAGARLGEAGGPAAPIDRRLRLTACPSSPEFSWRTEARDAIVIRCPEAGGWRIFVSVRAAPQLASASAKVEPVIRRGDPVTLVAEQSGFAVSADGIAMADAAPGGRVAIKMDGAKGPVQAIAVAAGKATLPGW
jgi:flagellar basal body P-ring formation protein FlgA